MTAEKQVDISEIFLSLEGEGIETGVPTVYIRFARCNKKCPLWNNPDKQLTSTGYADIGFNPKDYTDIKQMPLITKGCDSQYAVNPAFAHMWKTRTVEQLLTEVLDLLPGKSWVNPVSGRSVVLSLTGGEPTLYMKFILDLINHPLFKGCDHILFETNASVPLREMDISDLYGITMENDIKVTWSNSPKLSNSGEPWKKSIVPKVVLNQRYLAPPSMHQYFKFVVGSKKDVEEVQKAMEEYYAAGLRRGAEVVLMPEACNGTQQAVVMKEIADICIQNGYRFSIRLQNILWDNAVST